MVACQNKNSLPIVQQLISANLELCDDYGTACFHFIHLKRNYNGKQVYMERK